MGFDRIDALRDVTQGTEKTHSNFPSFFENAGKKESDGISENDSGKNSNSLFPAFFNNQSGTREITGEHVSTDNTESSEVSQNTSRELTGDEKEHLNETLGWSDKQIAKCTIDEDGVIHYKTDRCDLEGKTSENGVPYERKQIEINGVKIEGVFPKFNSAYTTALSPESQRSNTYAKECNMNLKETVETDPELRNKFTNEQLNDIENNRTPTGYVWHHNEEPGKMELVQRTDHDRAIGGAAHTGGSALWGPDSVEKKQGGEHF